MFPGALLQASWLLALPSDIPSPAGDHMLPLIRDDQGSSDQGWSRATVTQPASSIIGTLLTILRMGQCRYYVEQVAQQGYVGVIMSQSPEYVAPHGSSQAILGTNPIAVACPQAHGHPPLVVDFATSATTLYDLVAARESGDEVRTMHLLGPAWPHTCSPCIQPWHLHALTAHIQCSPVTISPCGSIASYLRHGAVLAWLIDLPILDPPLGPGGF